MNRRVNCEINSLELSILFIVFTVLCCRISQTRPLQQTKGSVRHKLQRENCANGRFPAENEKMKVKVTCNWTASPFSLILITSSRFFLHDEEINFYELNTLFYVFQNT